MSKYVAKLALGKAAEHMQNKPSIVERDPEIRAAIEATSASTKKHWWKKRPQADMILSAHDRQILRRVKSRAWHLDCGFQCCCCTVGLDGIIGLVPGIGDVICLFLALNLVRVASKTNLPNHILFKMLINVFVDFVLGLTPIAGDILDILFKCNWRNYLILEEYLFLRRRDELREERGVGGDYGSTGNSSISKPITKAAITEVGEESSSSLTSAINKNVDPTRSSTNTNHDTKKSNGNIKKA
ncbi:hypothetical protein INT45_001168, partial [Circinella minor]